VPVPYYPSAPSAQARAQDTASGPPAAQPINDLSIFGGASVVITDAAGNSTAPISGTDVQFPIPGVSTYTLGDNAEEAIFPTTGAYTVTFQTGNQPIAVEFTQGTGVTATQAFRYQDVTLPASTTVEMTFTDAGAGPLRDDSNGDGSFA